VVQDNVVKPRSIFDEFLLRIRNSTTAVQEKFAVANKPLEGRAYPLEGEALFCKSERAERKSGKQHWTMRELLLHAEDRI
jgi:hypothetical protein